MNDFTLANDKLSIIQIVNNIKNSKKVISLNKVCYYNIPISFDIETSSFLYKKEKCAIMYVWMLNINNYIILGRTWDEFYKLIDYIVSILKLNINNRLVIYIHNLGYEFGFIQSNFNWNEIKALQTHKLYKAVSENGIEFRCSYLLSGYNLQKVGENLKYHKSRKATGKLNYDLIRHTKTLLTADELEYCLSDVLVCTDYISEMIDEYGDISKIPNTKTGRVRRLFRKYLFNKNNKSKYIDLMSRLTFNDVKEYQQVKSAFIGGFTHCNPFYSNKLINDITLKIDFISSYPYVMLSENGFPMGKGAYVKKPTKKEFENYIKNYACVFTLILLDVKTYFPNDNYISASKCRRIKLTDIPLNNGRIVECKYLSISITNIDYEIISRNYNWSKMYVVDLYYYPRGYLPKEFVKVLIQLYKDKTELKGLDNKEAEYLHSKEDLNSSYGMSVTNIIRDIIEFSDNEWKKRKLTKKEIEEKINEYNNDKNRFLFYPWGVFITAFARKNLWMTIFNIGNDYVYSDTDSIVILHPEKHINFIKKYNYHVIKKLKKASEHYKLPLSDFMPMTKDGIIKPLGVWDIEDVCLRFKSLGSKRYMYEVPDTKIKVRKKQYKEALNSLLTDNPNWKYFHNFRTSGKHTKLNLTVAGVRKKEGMEYLDRNGHDKAFDYFSNELVIPAKYSGKSVLTYINKPRSGIIEDYLGNVAYFEEKTCVHFEKSDYEFNIESHYLDLIFGLYNLS